MSINTGTSTAPVSQPKRPRFSPGRAFLRKFLKQRVAVVALFTVLAITLIGFIAPFIVPYDPNRDVVVQYAGKGIPADQLSVDSIPVQLAYSDGSIRPLPVASGGAASGNRQVTIARIGDGEAVVTAVSAGTTYVQVRSGDVTSVLRVSVTNSSDTVLLSQLAATIKQPIAPGQRALIQLRGTLTDGTATTDPAVMQRAAEAAAALKGRQDSSGGWGTGSQALPTAPYYVSLTPDIARVTQTGEVTALAAGTGRIGVSLGGASTVVAFATDGSAVAPYPVGVAISKKETHIYDIYKHQRPSARHWFGTDHQNRDIFSRVLVGTRQTLLIGFLSVAMGAVLGTILGLLAGYYGGWLDNILSRACDVLLAFPGNLLAIAVIAVLGPGIINIILSVAIYSVPIFLRIVRGSTMEIKSRTYVEAARSIGVRDWTIIMRHIFPGTLSVLMVYLTMRIGAAILIGASLSFLGLGGDITAPEWGAMLSAAKDNSSTVFWPMFFPGLSIMLTVLAFNLFGDGLRDALDPKLRD